MVSEGVEYLSSSDHDYITDYSPVIAEMGMGEWINSTIGLEVTTIELGHFLGFPLMVDHLADAGGALDWTNLEAQEIIDGIRDLGIPEVVDPVVFVAHPRDGILGYFDQFGLNPYMDDNGDALIAPGTLSLFNPLISAEQYSDDFDAMEVLNGKRFELIRTPTHTEMSSYESDENSVSVAEMISRTTEEQEALISGDESLGYGMRGTVDDWFTLLNLGYRITALGNSDTHGKTTTESGCPRNYIQAETDDPAFFDEVSLAEAVREGRVITTYGPFIRFYANDIENGPGATVTGSEEVRLFIEVQSPSWFDVSQVELYENGTLVDSWAIQTPNDSVINFEIATDRTITEDAWYVVVALGTDDDLSPVFTPVEIAPIQLQDVVSDALSGVDAVATLLDSAVPIPRTFPIYPYGLTNPIWVDIDGDGFDAPGIPDWWIEPLAPEER